MQPIKNVLKRPTSSPTRNMLNAFFLPEDQDGFARSQGYADAEQMIHYEDTQRAEVPPPAIHELDKVDSREVYNEDEACPLTLWYDTGDELAGVY